MPVRTQRGAGFPSLRSDHLLPMVTGGLVRALISNRENLRYRFLKHLWIEVKRFGAPYVELVDLAQVRDIYHEEVCGPVWRHDPLVLCALCRILRCKTIFEIGTYIGETAWLLAHNNPRAHVYTLDLPSTKGVDQLKFKPTDIEYFENRDRGVRYQGTPEESRISQLFGDSATFDFSPYRGRVDLVYIDASHSYDNVRSDSQAALGMLSEHGTIVWDDYSYYTDIYRYLNQLSGTLDHPIIHFVGTRLAIYTRAALISHHPIAASRMNCP